MAPQKWATVLCLSPPASCFIVTHTEFQAGPYLTSARPPAWNRSTSSSTVQPAADSPHLAAAGPCCSLSLKWEGGLFSKACQACLSHTYSLLNMSSENAYSTHDDVQRSSILPSILHPFLHGWEALTMDRSYQYSEWNDGRICAGFKCWTILTKGREGRNEVSFMILMISYLPYERITIVTAITI